MDQEYEEALIAEQKFYEEKKSREKAIVSVKVQNGQLKPQFGNAPIGKSLKPATETFEDKAYLDQLDKSIQRSPLAQS